MFWSPCRMWVNEKPRDRARGSEALSRFGVSSRPDPGYLPERQDQRAARSIMSNGWWHPFAHGVNGVPPVARVGYGHRAVPTTGRTSPAAGDASGFEPRRGERVR